MWMDPWIGLQVISEAFRAQRDALRARAKTTLSLPTLSTTQSMSSTFFATWQEQDDWKERLAMSLHRDLKTLHMPAYLVSFPRASTLPQSAARSAFLASQSPQGIASQWTRVDKQVPILYN
ncbi:hypothetical protein BDR07DRAFT_1392793 [Suillus spraguei]|nr:hypothetical protein BDR07DRAFT_1392793 [Suillus spraguei]